MSRFAKVYFIILNLWVSYNHATNWDSDTAEAARLLSRISATNNSDEFIIRIWGGPNGEALEINVDSHHNNLWIKSFHFKLKKLISFWHTQLGELPEGPYKEGVNRALQRAIRLDHLLE
jgi:hypothetical protein